MFVENFQDDSEELIWEDKPCTNHPPLNQSVIQHMLQLPGLDREKIINISWMNNQAKCFSWTSVVYTTFVPRVSLAAWRVYSSNKDDRKLVKT